MAYLSLYNPTNNGCTFEIGLSSPFTSANYLHVVVCTVNNPYSGVVGSAYPYAGAGTVVYGTVSGLSSGTYYTLYAFAKSTDNNYYPAGSDTITTTSPTPPSMPYNINTSVSGLNVTITFTKGSGATETRLDRYWVGGDPDATTAGTSFSFSVPSYNSSYQYDLRSYNSSTGMVSGYTTATTFYTGSPPAPSAPTDFWVDTTRGVGGRWSSGSEGGLYLAWNASTNSPTSYYIQYKPSYQTTWQGEVSTGSSATNYLLRGLSTFTTYDIHIRAYNGQFGGYGAIETATTPPRDVSLAVTGQTSSYIEVTATGLNSGCYIDYTEYLSDGYTVNQTIKDTPYLTVQFNNPAGVTRQYRAYTYGMVSGTRLNSVNGSNVVVATTSSRPTNWAWSSTVSSGATFAITGTEWRNFIQKINDFYVYKNNTGYPWSANGNAPVSGEIVTASRFNEARNVIASMNSNGITSTRVTGDIIYASYLINLRDVLNAIA